MTDEAAHERVLATKPAAALEQLKARFPKAFALPVRPLKVGIRVDIEGALGPLGEADAKALSGALRAHCTSSWYLQAICDAHARVDLEGHPGDAPAEDQQRSAAKQLLERRQRVDAKRAAQALELDRQADAEREKAEAQKKKTGRPQKKPKPAPAPIVEPATRVPSRPVLKLKRKETT